MHDLSVSHIEVTHHRRESAPRKEMKPLLTHEPLPHDRERKPPAQPPKKRKRPSPTKPLLTFDPTQNHVPSGRLDSPVSPSIVSRPAASEPSASSHDQQQTSPTVDRIHGQFYDGNNAQTRPRIFSDSPSVDNSISLYPDIPSVGANVMGSVPHDPFQPPTSYVSFASPAPPDQSPRAAEFPVHIGYTPPFQPLPTMFPYTSQGYGSQPMIHHPSCYTADHSADRPTQNYPMQQFDPAHGRAGPHGAPTYPEPNGYSYPPRTC